jgi:pyruvate,orthophosphate dikinase
MAKQIYFFSGGHSEGDGSMKELLGGKGANLAEMSRIGLPVPPGFTLSTKLCLDYQDSQHLPDDLMAQVRTTMERLEEQTHKTFGRGDKPLLVSVRSGAAVSMPGMMDTVLNLGLNTEVRNALETLSGSPRFARDSHRRFIQMFANVVDAVPSEHFEHELERLKMARMVKNDTDLKASDLDTLIARYLRVYEEQTGRPFPTDPWEQLERAITAVFASWSNPRAITYRRLNRISDDLGTAVNVQAMAYGNLGNDCGTGVGFTRDPSTGENIFYGEFLPNAQGEDVVAGIRTPYPVREARARLLGLQGHSLEESFPDVHAELMKVATLLEGHYRDIQDIEFTIEHGKLYLLQTRTAKRTGQAWVRSQCELVDEGTITPQEAVMRVPADTLSQLLAPNRDPRAALAAKAEGRLLAVGLNAGPGAATGYLAFTADDAHERVQAGEKVILVRHETTPEDIHGMYAAEGILTARGGLTSHAAVIARGMGKPCVVGCQELHIDLEAKCLRIGEHELTAEHEITIDGTSGEVYAGTISIVPSEILQVEVEGTLKAEESPIYQGFARLLGWADEFRRMGVRTNADSPEDSRVALALGAEGIGLCRTEHMFFEADRIRAMRRMILAASQEERTAALAEIEPMQREDFVGIFRTMGNRPVTVRTLDPPLHEFLPHTVREIEEIAREFSRPFAEVKKKVDALHESNPMLGHRGCRLGIAYPEITRMQARAIIGAALEVAAEGVDVRPEIMIPLVGNVAELALQKADVIAEIDALFEKTGRTVNYLIGTMIEIPRAALTAGEIAQEAEFFSYGTNDLTQMTLGVSRDDAGAFLPDYVERGIYAADPFVSVDKTGVGRLMTISAAEGREARPGIKLGICGEHGGDPDTVYFCDSLGLDYVSCSPYRVPVARLAAAQATLSKAL